MKKVTTFIAALAAVCICQVATAQKIGRVAFQEILMVHPQADSVQIKIENHGKMLEADLEQMSVEFNKKYEDYQKRQATFSPAINAQKQKELADFNTRITEFRQTAQQEMQNLNVKLMQPLYVQISESIKKIAKQKGLEMIVDLSQGSNILYIDEATTTNITPLVRTDLGISPNAKPKLPMQQPMH